MINLFRQIVMALIGVALLPLTITVSRAFYNQLSGISIFDSRNQVYFLWGLFSYLVLHLFFFKPTYIYNLGHEAVHVISTWLSLGRAKKVKVSSQGGSVQTTRSNFFISISPYFVPIYTVILCLAYFLAAKFGGAGRYVPYVVFFIGLTLAMHIILTVDALKTAQPDLLRTGYLFSLSLIYVINVIVAAFMIGLIFAGFAFTDFFLNFWFETKELYMLIFRQLFGV